MMMRGLKLIIRNGRAMLIHLPCLRVSRPDDDWRPFDCPCGEDPIGDEWRQIWAYQDGR